MSYHVDSRYISLYTWSAIIQVYHYCTTWTHLPFVWGCNWLWDKFNPFELKSMLVHIFNKFGIICQLVDCLFLAHSTVDIYYPLYINVIFTFSLINLKILLLYTHLALSYYIYWRWKMQINDETQMMEADLAYENKYVWNAWQSTPELYNGVYFFTTVNAFDSYCSFPYT